jgi:hypothetical protein
MQLDRINRFHMIRNPVGNPANPVHSVTKGRASYPVVRPVFKTGWGRQAVPGGFDSHVLPPFFAAAERQPGDARPSPTCVGEGSHAQDEQDTKTIRQD